MSAPAVQAEITNGQAVISGSFKTYAEADELASMIRIGALPVELKEIQSQVVGAQLGQDAITTSLIAGAIGFGLVVLFMLVFYGILRKKDSTQRTCCFYCAAFLPCSNACGVEFT